MHINQRGFTHFVALLLVIFVFSVMGLIGWRVYDSKRNPIPSGITINKSKKVVQDKPKTSTRTESSKVPNNYTTYENIDIGFKFSYPKEWGTIVRTGDDTPTLITNGLNGHALRTMFENGDVNTLPRGNHLNGDVSPGVDEGHYGGGYIQEGAKYYSTAKYTADKIQIPEDRILAEVKSGLGTVLIINAGTIAGDRLQLLLNLPTIKSLSGLDLVFKNSNEDFADESKINVSGLETLKTVAQTFEAL